MLPSYEFLIGRIPALLVRRRPWGQRLPQQADIRPTGWPPLRFDTTPKTFPLGAYPQL